jgi:hypothetical protein
MKNAARQLCLCAFMGAVSVQMSAQVVTATRSGFSWIDSENISDMSFDAGYTAYAAAWPIFDTYPGSDAFQMGLASCWMTTQQTGNEPEQFYTTIEGGLGWWMDTRFATRIPKFIMGGVSHNFFGWANGPGAGKTSMLSNGQRDWSTPGGKYGVAQLSNRLVWAPDGLNMAQGLNGELLGYGYNPLPLMEPLTETNGQAISTGNQCWTLFLNSTNFKGPATFFMPTFWTEPVLEDPSLEGLYLDTRPANPNVPFGWEHALSPALISEDNEGTPYAKIEPMQMPASGEDYSVALNGISIYSRDGLWDAMNAWFDGGDAVPTEAMQNGSQSVSFTNNGGAIVGEISGGGMEYDIDLDYLDNTMLTFDAMGFEHGLNATSLQGDVFALPEYFKLEGDNEWHPITVDEVPASTQLATTEVPTTPRPETTYLTPLEPDCAFQDANGPWSSPGPAAGPFYTDLGDGSTATYYWYRFVDQPAIVHANLPDSIRDEMQARVELIHSNWNLEDEYMAPPTVGNLATVDPGALVVPPAGMEVGYVPIVTRQESTPEKLRVFILAGQSNMQGYGKIATGSNGAAGITVASFTPTCEVPGAATCDFTLEMTDTFGDGWNGWTYDFVQNGAVVATGSLPNGESGSLTVTLENGVTCDIVIGTAGAYGNEVGWTLTDASGNAVASLDGQPADFPSPNTLVDVVNSDATGEWSMLGTEDDWTTLDDVHLYFPNGAGDTIRDHVTVGQGAYPDLIGPELMFAHELGAYFEDPVLIIKTAWGGLSLAEDFRPPSAGGTTGPYYNTMIETVEAVTQNLDTEFPDIEVDEFEISGFAWFQGWNDGASAEFLNTYESNLHHLVNDVRNDLDLPELPVVIQSSGHGGYENFGGWIQDMQDIVAVAQENVGCNDSIYGGTVGFVDTKPLWITMAESPDDAGFHFHNNARTFLNIGKTMGEEMILAINDMAYCNGTQGPDCDNLISPGFVSIGNRVWNDLNMDGINDSNEPGIAGVSVVIWSDPDGDGIPDWEGFGGVEITDEEGYYRFDGLTPGNYVVFVWQVDNWDDGEPLQGFQSTVGYVADADNDVDLDNNGFGPAFSDIMSGIVTLTLDGEPLNDGDPEDCFFDYDPGGNNTVDFGFYNPNTTSVAIENGEAFWTSVYPNPAKDQLNIQSSSGLERIDLLDALGRVQQQFRPMGNTHVIDVSSLTPGVYVLRCTSTPLGRMETRRFVKQ